MRAEYRAYPPQTADDIEIIEQPGGSRPTFIAGRASTGRFILLGETELRVMRLLTGALAPADVCLEFSRLYNGRLSLRTLGKFLSRLDEVGILAGERASAAASTNLMPGPQFYARWKLFNPDRLFEKIIPCLGWIWTKGFVIVTLLLMALVLFLSMSRPAELTSYTIYMMHEHYLAVLITGALIGFSHEFAHGLTCKAFGGRVTEVGVLMIYYLLPALYCNVSGSYLIAERSRRLWVIAAGVYWQVMVGAFALLGWLSVEPYTLISDLSFILFLGSVLNVIFNANPLIRLDGYYFLSQFLRLPNLMDRSRAYWRGCLKRILFGDSDDAARRWSRRERSIYAAFGLTSFAYTVGLRAVIVIYVGSYLADQFNLAGLAVAAGLSVFYMRGPLGVMTTGIREALLKGMSKGVMKKGAKTNKWRRRVVWLALAAVVTAVLCTPWNASVGGYGALVPISGREAIIRAPEDANLVELRSQPGDLIGAGSVIGRMGNLDLEEQIVEAQTELARAKADYERLAGELRARQEVAVRAELQLARRRHDFDEISTEREQIDRHNQTAASHTARLVSVSSPPGASPSYPAAIAVLEADLDLLKVQLQEATVRVERSRMLFSEGVVSRSEIESAETRAATLAFEIVRARQRLEAALIEHRRKYIGASVELEQAGSDLRAERVQTELLGSQLVASREMIRALETRLDLLRRKQARFELVTSLAGTVYGEDLPRMVGRHFQKGEEICRVADTREMLVRIQLPEREIGDVKAGNRVRLKVRAYAGRVFYGVVSRVGEQSERDEHNQTIYRVELAIENEEGSLRPGMTAFARIDFGRQMIGQILRHKLWQLMRPEVWLL